MKITYVCSWIRPGMNIGIYHTVYPKKWAHGFVVLCFVVVVQSFIMDSHEVFIHIHQGCFAGTGAIVRLPQCQWSKPDGYGKISQCITTTKHSKEKNRVHISWDILYACFHWVLICCRHLIKVSNTISPNYKFEVDVYQFHQYHYNYGIFIIIRVAKSGRKRYIF